MDKNEIVDIVHCTMVAKIGSWLLDMERWRVNIIFKGQVFSLWEVIG